MSGKARAMVVAGFVLHVLLLPVFLASGLVVPGPVVPLLFGIWALLLVAAIQRRNRPGFVLAVPGIALVTLIVVVQGGSWIFGWTA